MVLPAFNFPPVSNTHPTPSRLPAHPLYTSSMILQEVTELRSYKTLAIKLLYLCCEFDVAILSSKNEPQWLQYFKLVFLKIQNVTIWSVLLNLHGHISLGQTLHSYPSAGKVWDWYMTYHVSLIYLFCMRSDISCYIPAGGYSQIPCI